MPAPSLPAIKMCKDCSEIAISSDGRCFAHARVTKSMRSYCERPMPTSTMKNPFGVELECKGNETRKINVVGCVCRDGSLGDNGAEIKVVADASRIGNKAADTAQRARFAGGYVDKNCGLHVHTSLPKISGPYGQEYKVLRSSDFEKIFQFTRNFEDLFFDLVPPSRRNNTYCRKLTSASSIDSHYSWISRSCNVPTLEVRIHPGTLNPWKVKAWTEVCRILQKGFHDIIMKEPADYSTVTQQLATERGVGVLKAFKKIPLAYRYLSERLNSDGKLKNFGFKAYDSSR